MTPFLAHSTPFRSHRSLSKVSTNSGEAHSGIGPFSLSRSKAVSRRGRLVSNCTSDRNDVASVPTLGALFVSLASDTIAAGAIFNRAAALYSGGRAYT